MFNESIIFVVIQKMSIESLSAAYNITYSISPYKLIFTFRKLDFNTLNFITMLYFSNVLYFFKIQKSYKLALK